jgi:hypothetical protein
LESLGSVSLIGSFADPFQDLAKRRSTRAVDDPIHGSSTDA